jgi:O-methyltransferase involved in polyketide biosynthesis
VFDYAIPPDRLMPRQRARFDEIAGRVAAAGEPWRTFFEPSQIEARLRAMGFSEIEDVDADVSTAGISHPAPTDFASRVLPEWRTLPAPDCECCGRYVWPSPSSPSCDNSAVWQTGVSLSAEQ